MQKPSSRYDYVAYDEVANKAQAAFKAHMRELEDMIELILPAGRYKALAITASEELYCWIGKALRDDQIARNGSASLEEGRSNS